MAKIIVTHFSPDLDAATSSWLIKRFMPGWKDARMQFVPAGTALNDQAPDIDPNILHVDTGLGKFDHHQTNEYTSATKRVFEYLLSQNYFDVKTKEPLERMVNFVNEIDHFAEVNFPDPTADRYDFSLYQILDSGIKQVLQDDLRVIDYAHTSLDAILHMIKNKVSAERELQKGLSFQSKWGKTLAIESKNEEVIKFALKSGFSLVARKDPGRGSIRIKTLPRADLDLTSIYEKLKALDPKATWFLHISKNMLLNGSSKNQNSVPSKLPLQKVIEIIKEIE